MILNYLFVVFLIRIKYIIDKKHFLLLLAKVGIVDNYTWMHKLLKFLYAYVHTYTHVYTHTYTYTYTYAHIHIHLYIYKIQIHIYIYIYNIYFKYIYTNMDTHICFCIIKIQDFEHKFYITYMGSHCKLII